MKQLTQSEILSFVVQVANHEFDQVMTWLQKRGFTHDAVEQLYNGVGGAFHFIDYIDTHSPFADESHLLERFYASRPAFELIMREYKSFQVGHNLTKKRKERCPENYFESVAKRIVSYLNEYHSDKYENGEWIASHRYKKIIKELFYVAYYKGIFQIDECYSGERLSQLFLQTTGILYSPKRFNDLKKYPDFNRDAHTFSEIHHKF